MHITQDGVDMQTKLTQRLAALKTDLAQKQQRWQQYQQALRELESDLVGLARACRELQALVEDEG